jgi:hypothetical protein
VVYGIYKTNITMLNIKKIAYFLLTFISIFAIDLNAQSYEFTINQRRRFDQIEAEIWVKRKTFDAPKLGYASLVIEFNSTFLKPSLIQKLNVTDSINRNLSKSVILDQISSPFDAQNGYAKLVSTQITSKYYSLELSLGNLGNTSFIVDSNFRGTFIGKVTFDIINNPTNTSNTDIKWSSSKLPGDIRIFASDSTDIESKVLFKNPNDLTVVGVTLLNPGYKGQTLDRDKAPLGVNGGFAKLGHPIYIERSVNPTKYRVPNTAGLVDDNVAFLYEYSLDDGLTWKEIGRAAERNTSANNDGNNPKYRFGEISNPPARFYITSQDSIQLNSTNYRKPTRVIWANNNYFTERSENARIRVTQLDGNNTTDLVLRPKSNLADSSKESFVLGRLFFAQLNGKNQFFKTEKPYSNSTQLTVEAWVNLNDSVQSGTPAIIASSSGTDPKSEGAWMLYLENGATPAFRAKEILGRGVGGYIGKVTAIYPLRVVLDTLPYIVPAHSTNWTHLAATVENNIVRLYVDGELVDESINTNAADIRMQTTNHPIWVGVNPNSTFAKNNFLNAGFKGVKVWRTALSQNQIRSLVNGVVDPSIITQPNDIKKSLESYYDFEGNDLDLASNPAQNGSNNLIYFTSVKTPNVDSVFYRPDRPHIRITSPTKNVGLTNNPTDIYDVRWLAFGMAEAFIPNSKDLELQYSTDQVNWYGIKTEKGDTIAVDAEKTTSNWVPYNNNNPSANLRSALPFKKDVSLRIKGASTYGMQEIFAVEGPFTVARYLSFKRDSFQVLTINGKLGMNLTKNNAYIETWIRPYSLPSASYTILSKIGTDSSKAHFNLALLSTGQLKFSTVDIKDTIRTAISDTLHKILAPNKVTLDTAWTHIGVFIDNNGGNGQSKILFYINGTVQNDTSITNQLGLDLQLNSSNTFPTYIGSSPFNKSGPFLGELRELRFWNGVPNNLSYIGDEPTQLTEFIQGSLNVRTQDLKPSNQGNLFAAFPFNGTTFNYKGKTNTVPAINNPSIYARFGIDTISYIAAIPFIKLVEPVFRQKVSNTSTDAKVRWVGFDYDGLAISNGSFGVAPSLEYSSRGGGGLSQLYKYIGSTYYLGNSTNSSTIPDSTNFVFKGGTSDVVYALKLNASLASPDVNNDGITNDQGPLNPALTNARLRLNLSYTIENVKQPLVSESPLFTITPIDNFTIRVLLEGHHDGLRNSFNMRNIGTLYPQGAIRITLFEENAGVRGKRLLSELSRFKYEERDPLNRNAGNRKFANVNYLITDISDGKYWVMVEQQNHLPIMSRFPVSFKYDGDNKSTWAIESGWDFATWDGVEDNIMKFETDDAISLKSFNAKGDAKTTVSDPNYNTTGLIFNNGPAGSKTIAIAAMVGGDVNQDGQINAADRVQVRVDDGTNNPSSDVTGDGFVNADDRTIVDRNFGKVSSLYAEPKGVIESDFKNYVVLKPKKENEIQAGALNYKVNAVTKKNGDFATVDFYIRNISTNFKLANSTFAISYDTSAVKFESLNQIDTIIFANKPQLGYYSKLRSAPTDDVDNKLTGVRTIEIDYDKNFINGGINVPYKDTYLGTLKFKILSKDKVIKFNWHNSTSLHSVDNEIVTPYGEFDTISPILQYSAKITTPNGGESYLPSRVINVNWTTDGSQKVRLDLTINGGTNWQTSGTFNVNVKTATMQLPNFPSTNCLVRLVDLASGAELDRSDAFWSIQAGFAKIISPNASEPIYKGGNKAYIQFVAKGYPKVKFEFTEDGVKWYQLLSSVDGNLTSVEWNIPFINTKNAQIRMADIDNGQEIAISDVFKIITGTVKFKNPVANESVLAGSTYRVRWNSTNLKRFDIQISYNNGISWVDELKYVDVILGYVPWVVPTTLSNNVMLRAVLENDPSVEFDRTKPFTIWDGTKVEDKIEGIDIMQISPNPADHNALIEINSNNECKLNFVIIDVRGNSIKEYQQFITIGNNKINIDLNDLGSGSYFVVIKQNNKTIIRELKVVK